MSPEKRPKILDLITKLKALSADAANEHEAALAAERMQELIARHKIDSAELMDLERDDEPEPSVHELYSEAGRNFARWRLNLAHLIAHANNCCGLHTKGGIYWEDDGPVHLPAKMEIVGTPENVAACQYVFKYLSREIDRLAKEANSVRLSGMGGRKFTNAFRVGAVAVVARRLRDLRRRVTSESETAMVLFDEEMAGARQWAMERFDVQRAGSITPQTSSLAGFAAGARAGESLCLDTNGRGALDQPKKELPNGECR